eukprot:CAMPEP_0197465342 /NCGR_PEP_ID=MMETSP1175-20131217/64481_1 /TAXON_ID=1003142 /ORGANISM="Triceratium dubium, Strain CCMP147" /LENGTH=1388 /DNA_ID=CAMNT_0043001353 /DNA_START=200 /DNA_END=4369 /DNA_ORIENTATION=+
MADAMLNPSYRESTLPPLPLPAALPSVGSFAHMTPAPLPPPPPAPAPPPTAQQPSPSSKSDGGSAAEVGAQGGNNNSGHGDPQRQLQDRPPSPLPIRPAPAPAQAPAPPVAPVAPCSGAGPLGPPPHGSAALMPSPPPPPLPPPPAATPPQVAEVSPHLHPQPGPGQGPQGPQQGHQGQGTQGQGPQGPQEQISPHLHPQPNPGQGHTGSGPGDDNVVIQSHRHHHPQEHSPNLGPTHQQEHSPNLGPTHQQEHSPSLGPHHQPQPQQPQSQPQQHHRGHSHHHHHQHHRDATNKRGDDSQRGPNEGHSEKQGVAVAVADDAKPIEKTVVINLPPEAAERARDALAPPPRRHSAAGGGGLAAPAPSAGAGQGGPQQGHQGQGQQGQGQQEQISPHIHPQPGPGQGHAGSGPGDDHVVIQSHHRHHHHPQEHSPNLGPTHQQEHSPSLGPHHQPQSQHQTQVQQPHSQPQQQHHRGHSHHHHHQHHRDATNKRGEDSQRGPNEGHSEKQGVAVAVADDAKPIEKTVVINLPPEAAERARDALDRHAAREEEVARIVRDLNLAVSPTDRNRALQSALSTFDHANAAMHDGEIDAGADCALTKHLALLLLKERQSNAAMHDGEIDAGADCALTKHLALLLLKERQSSHQGGGEGGGVKNEEGSSEGSPRLGPLDSSGSSSSSAQTEELCEEITNVTEALEMMYRCSAERVRESYGRVGSELLPMLMSLVERDLGKRRRALASCSASAAVAAAAAARAAASAEEEVDEDELDEEKKRKQRQQDNRENHQEAESAEAENNEKEDRRPEKKRLEDETDDQEDGGGPPLEKKRKVSEDGSPVLASVAFASSTKDAATASAASASASSPAAATIPHDCATRQSSLGHACDYVSPTRNRRLRKITKVFGHFARVGALTQPLAYHSGLLSTLKHVIELPAGAGVGGVGSGLGGDGVGSGLAVPREARLNCLWILANLACNAENMVMMACQPGLLDLLVRTALSPAQTSEDDYGDIDRYMEAIRSRSIAVRALLNLSWAPENKLLLSEHSRLVGALTEALSYRASSWAGFGRGVSGILLQTRRLAAGALRNLAAAPIRNKIRLCRQPLLQHPHGHSGRGSGTGSIGGGGGSQSLLDELTDAARHDPDAQVRDKAVATLHNLACADTAGGFARRPALLEVLSDAAMAYHNAYNNGGGSGGAGGTRMPTTGRYTADAGNLANRTLRVLERSITEDMVEEYRAVRPLLDGVANAAAGRVSVEEGGGGRMNGNGGKQGRALLDELTDAARHDPDAQVRDKAVATLHNLACADTAGGFARRPALLEVLSDAAMAYHNAYNNGGGTGAGTRMPTTGRYTADAGNLANRTLRVLERSITEDMVEEYRAVRPLLDGVANAAAGRVSV